MNLPALFPDEDYHFAMRFERGLPESFFAPTAAGPRVLAERRQWLDADPAACAAFQDEAAPLLAEMISLLRAWPATREIAGGLNDPSPSTNVALGRRLEPDFLLLAPDGKGAFRLRAGCVCFPSSWELAEKLGRTIEEIHGIVPGLNAALARPISGFLAKMPPGISWLRANWGLTRSPELNHHPARRLPRLDASVLLDEVSLRLEHQSLVALPETRGVLFGIRVEVFPLADVLREPPAARGLARALRTMPADVAAYKGLALARPALLAILAAHHSG